MNVDDTVSVMVTVVVIIIMNILREVHNKNTQNRQ